MLIVALYGVFCERKTPCLSHGMWLNQLAWKMVSFYLHGCKPRKLILPNAIRSILHLSMFSNWGLLLWGEPSINQLKWVPATTLSLSCILSLGWKRTNKKKLPLNIFSFQHHFKEIPLMQPPLFACTDEGRWQQESLYSLPWERGSLRVCKTFS